MNTLIYRRRFQDVFESVEPVLYPEHENAIVPDQSPNNPKFYDSHGYMQSDVAILFQAVTQQNNELASSLRNKFSQSVDNSRLEGMTDDQMFSSTPSRYAQSPSEVQSQAVFISDVLDVDNSPADSSVSDDAIKFSPGDADNSDAK